MSLRNGHPHERMPIGFLWFFVLFWRLGEGDKECVRFRGRGHDESAFGVRESGTEPAEGRARR